MQHTSIAAAAAVLLLATASVSSSSHAQSFSDFVATAAGCALIGESRASMPVEPLYQRMDGACVANNPRGSSILESLSWFEDENCSTRVGFVPTPLLGFCAQIADDVVLGTADNIIPNTWTLTPGSRIDVGVQPLDGVPQPYMQRIRYANFPTLSGQCELEMRVYKSHPGATGLRSMVALHGGAWRFRGFGYFGLEISVPHLVNEGFVVYAPFYRLLDDVDGSVACQNAEISELVADAQTALDWAQDNASRYGSSGKPVVFGQSAGAHLAGSLWLNRRNDISGAVLLYPPTDFTDFAERVQSGDYTNEDGVDILELVLGTDASQADFTQSPISENSYPQQVVADSNGLAPVMLLHGSSDTLVEDRQSIRLCNALANRPINSDVSDVSDGLRTIVSCEPSGTQQAVIASTLHLFDQGQHAMDLCIDGGLLAGQTCPAGSTASANAIGESLQIATRFASQAFDSAARISTLGVSTNMADEESTGELLNDGSDVMPVRGSSGGGSGSGLLLALMAFCVFVRRDFIFRGHG